MRRKTSLVRGRSPVRRERTLSERSRERAIDAYNGYSNTLIRDVLVREA